MKWRQEHAGVVGAAASVVAFHRGAVSTADQRGEENKTRKEERRRKEDKKRDSDGTVLIL